MISSVGGALAEIVSAYADQLLHCLGWLLCWVVFFRGILSVPLQRWFSALPQWARVAILALGAAAAVGWAWHLVSLFDDAYISLRYAQNLVRGNGLVFNIGDRVEGYTNFLWTMLLAASMALHLDGPQTAIIGCLSCFVLELLLLARLSGRLSPGKAGIPIASVLFGASYMCASYGTTGMETMLSAVLVTLMLQGALSERLGWAGVWGTLGILNHPDFALLYAGLGVALACDRARWRRLPWYVVSPVLLYLPYFVWRWRYYGELFPNTYYAKSADLPYYRQGVVYLVASLLGSGAWALLPLAAFALKRRPRHLLTAFCVFGVAPALLYVTRIGGDFMLGRLLVPLLPVFAILADLGVRDLMSEAAPFSPGWPAFVLPAIAVLPVHLIGNSERRWNLSDERTWYQVASFSPEVTWEVDDRTQALLDLVRHGQRPVVAEIPVGREAFMTDLVIVDVVGLTDKVVAHQPLVSRGLPGHEKRASRDYLRSRDVGLSIFPLVDPAYAQETEVRVHQQRFYLAHYDQPLLQAIRSLPDSFAPNLPEIIDRYLSKAHSGDRARIARDVEFFDEFYFSSNNDPDRRSRLHALTAKMD